MGHSYTGQLLISRPELSDPNFDGTITFLLEHGPDGALGLVINRPTQLQMSDPFPEWNDLGSGPGRIFSGGPVQTNGLIAIGRDGSESGKLVYGLHSVDLDEDPGSVKAGGMVEVRIFAGHAGWGAGQLEGEIATGAWWLSDGAPSDLFCDRPGRIWADVMKRNGGEMAWFAHLPADPSLN